jgi:ribosomal protein L12E/L44/L45/RPP1/RPP2
VEPEERRAVLSKAKRLRLLVGAFLLALSVSVSGVAMTGCAGGVTEEQKKEKKEEAKKKEEESKKKQEEKAEEQ